MRHKYIIISGLVGVFLALGALFFLGSARATSTERVLEGVRFMGADLSGLDRQALINKLEIIEKELLTTPVLLKHEDKSWQVHPSALGAGLDVAGISHRALRAGKEGSFINKWLEQSKIKEEGREIPPLIRVDQAVFNNKLDQLTVNLVSLPQNADFRVGADDTVEIIPGRDGVLVDKEKALHDFQQVLRDPGATPVVEISLTRVHPERTTEEVQSYGLDGVLATFATRFNASVADRSYNIRVAAAALDNLLVPPGQEVSFNKVVGPRSSEAGYKNAKVIVNNELVDGLGGGVCQVSTTLYNSVLLAGLGVVSRNNHSLPVSYVPAGRDATVAYDTIDFVFRNNTPKHIYLKTFVSGGKITVKIYGHLAYKKQITVRTTPVETYDFKVVYEPDSTLPKGVQKVKQEGAKGSRIVAQRVVLDNGVARVEPLPGSLYHPMNKIVLVGTGENAGAVQQPGSPVNNPGPPGGQPNPDNSAANPDHQTQPPGGNPDQNPPTGGGNVSQGGQGSTPAGGGIVPPAPATPADPVNSADQL